MPFYSLLLEGKNFPKRISAEADGLVGFFTTRWVEAADPASAEVLAVDLIKAELLPTMGTRRDEETNPTIWLDEINEIDALPKRAPGRGFTWFEMEE